MSAPPAVDLTSIEFSRWQLRRIQEDETTNSDILDRELELDKVGRFFQPWETAARLLENTEYEVTDGLNSKRREKILALRRTQKSMNLRFNIRVVAPSRTTGTPTIVGKFIVK